MTLTIMYSLLFIFVWLYGKAELISLFEFKLKSRLVWPSGTKASSNAATCLGLPLNQRMFAVSSHVEMREARAGDTFPGRVQLPLRSVAARAPSRHTSRFVPMLTQRMDMGLGRGEFSNFFTF